MERLPLNVFEVLHYCNRYIRLFFLVVVFTGSFDSLWAIQQPHVINFNKEQYGGYSKNWSVSHSRQGMIYIGNDEGLLEYDGINWVMYPLPNGTKVRAVLVGNDQRIYTGSYEEFGYWEKGDFGQLHYTSLSDSLMDFKLHNEEIWKIVEGEAGKIYFQSFSVVFCWDGKKVQHFQPSKSILFLLKARKKFVAQETRDNLLEFTGSQFVEISGSSLQKKAFTRVFLPYGENGFLLGSIKKGLTIWDHSGFRIWDCPAQDSLRGKEINRGVWDGHNYYIGTIQDGVYVINPKGEVLSHLNTQNYLESNTVLGLDLDPQGRLWMALNNGISCVDFNYPVNYVVERKSDIGVVHTAALHQGALYLGTNQGVYRYPTGGKDLATLKLNEFQLIPESVGQVWSLEVIDGQLLCGHNTGTFRIEKDKMVRISSTGGGYNFRKLVAKGQDFLIQSTYTSLVLFRKDKDGRWTFFRNLRGFREPSRFISVDPFGNIWVNHSHKKEVYKVRLSQNFRKPVVVEKYGKAEGLPSDLGFHVFEFYNRIVFTSSQGIYTYDDLQDTIVPYEQLNRCLDEYISAHRIIKGNDGGYWFVKKRKMAFFQKQQGGFEKKMELLLNEPNRSLVEGHENIIPLTAMEALICLENGYAVLKMDSLNRKPHSESSIFFREISGHSQTMEEKHFPLKSSANKVILPYFENSIRFQYSSISSPGKPIRFQTQLEGLDSVWSAPSFQTSLEYYRLPWGMYVFKVKGEDEFGNALPEVSYSFEIRPPWYATMWAIGGFSSIGLFLIVIVPIGIRRYYRKQRKAYQLEQERIMREKQEEERRAAEQKMIKLRNENLRNELSHKSSELANSTMSIIRKNAVLLEVKEEILKQKEELKQRYPAKYLERVVKLIDKNINNEDDWKIFEQHFDRAHVDFFNRLKNEYPDLTPKDLRLCAYLKMNLTTKEIAPLLNISPRSVEVHRYRLRKKLDFSSSDNLTEFMIQF
ncbi:MAG: LuxR C-terminal-related transcriptional regulator [Marinifilaceae bacterium]